MKIKLMIVNLLLLITTTFSEPIAIHVTKSPEGDKLTVSCEYMEKVTISGVFYVYVDKGEITVKSKNGTYTFKESNILWYTIESN